jgi:PKD repeat protein
MLLLFASCAFAQFTPITPYEAASDAPEWVKMMYDGAAPAEVRAAYEAYYAEHPFAKTRDTQFYKRYMRNAQLTGTPYGRSFSAPNADSAYLANFQAQKRLDGGWEELGPWHYDPEVAMSFEVQSPGAAHIYTVEQAASNPDIVWAGSATAGIWKSTDKGMHWELMSKDLLVTEVYSIAIHPVNPDVVYFGEGNGKLWKTTDGGLSWSLTGDADFQNQNFHTRDLRFQPGNPDRLFAATSTGLLRSDDAGTTWVELESQNFMEIEFHPTNPDIIYTIGLQGNFTFFLKSTDGGDNFESGVTGWPAPGVGEEQRRCEMAVSAATPDRVYVLAAGQANGGGGLYGIYVSDDAGESFSFQCCGTGPAGEWAAESNPNILGWSEDGSGDGGQYYYDLALGASPDTEDRIFGAGINVWRSLDAGQNWDLNAHWVTWVGEFTQDRYSHADVHDIKFFETENGIDMWVTSDGGLYYSDDQGDHLEPRMYGIHGTDFWGWQAGFRDGDVMVGGTYHNGTLIKYKDIYHWGADDATSGGWLAELGGDNYRGFVNPGDASRGYHDGGAFDYSDDRWTRITGASFDNTKRANTSYWWGEYGNMEWDPRCYNIVYSPVEDDLWRSENGGQSWELVHSFGGDKIISVKSARRDPNLMYVSHRFNGGQWNIWRTSDGGINWEEISISNAQNGGNSGRPIYLEVDGENPDRLWAIIIGNHEGYKIFESVNGGDTWTDLTTASISDEYIISIAHQRGTDGGVYLGTNRAVYFKDDNMADWELYNANLPAQTPMPFLQPYYCEGKIRGAGSRGVHQNDFYTPSEPQAAFMADKLNINLALQCAPDTIRFSDTSALLCEGATFEWVFEGGAAEAADGPEPRVTYAAPGTYDVTLTITDADDNSDSYTWEDMITVVDEPLPLPIVEDFNAAFPPANWKIESSGLGTWEWGTDLTDETNRVAQFPNYWVDTQGNPDLLVMPAVDLTELEEPLLHFDVAHVQFNEYVDGLEVWYQLEGSEEWTPIYSKFGADLTVEDCYIWWWYDLGGETVWRTDTVDLSPIADQSCVTLAFANIGGYGNHIWIDNVNLTTEGAVGVEETAEASWTVYPNPSRDAVFVTTPAEWHGLPLRVRDMSGRIVYEEQLRAAHRVDISMLADGLYVVEIPGKAMKRILKQ